MQWILSAGSWLFERSWKFILSVVVPVTVWFTLTNRNIADLSMAHDKIEQRVDKIENISREDKRDLDKKLDKIIFKIGELTGEIRRNQ